MFVTVQFNWTSLEGMDVKFNFPVAYFYPSLTFCANAY